MYVKYENTWKYQQHCTTYRSGRARTRSNIFKSINSIIYTWHSKYIKIAGVTFINKIWSLRASSKNTVATSIWTMLEIQRSVCTIETSMYTIENVYRQLISNNNGSNDRERERETLFLIFFFFLNSKKPVFLWLCVHETYLTRRWNSPMRQV